MQPLASNKFEVWLERLGVRSAYDQAERLPADRGCGNQTVLGQRLVRRFALEVGRDRFKVVYNPKLFA